MPRLETQTGAAPIDVTRFAGDRTVEKISRVELHARFGGRYVQRSAAGRIHYARRVAQRAARAVQHDVVVVAFAVAELLVLGVDAPADRGRTAELERRAFDRRQLAGRNERRVDRREPIGVDRQLVPQDVAVPLAREVEVAVLRQVDWRRFVGRCVVADRQLARRREGAGHTRGHRAGVLFFAILARVGVGDADDAAAVDRRAAPQRLVEALDAAVQVIGTVVRGEL